MTGEAWLSEMKRVDSLSKEQIKRLQPQADKQDADFRRDYLLMPESEKWGAVSKYIHTNALGKALMMVEYHVRVLEIIEEQGYITPMETFTIMTDVVGVGEDKIEDSD